MSHSDGDFSLAGMSSKAARSAATAAAAAAGAALAQHTAPRAEDACACCGETDDADDMRVCARCGVRVHVDCFGAGGGEGPRGAWTCALCAAGVIETPACLLCGLAAGNRAMKRVVPAPDVAATRRRLRHRTPDAFPGRKGINAKDPRRRPWVHLTCGACAVAGGAPRVSQRMPRGAQRCGCPRSSSVIPVR